MPGVGKDVATFIDFLNECASMPFNTLTLIGHSLGADVCGFAAKLLTRGAVLGYHWLRSCFSSF